MSASLVSNLLEFMYQGSVNVKQEQLKDFMSIAETLQIKGLTTSTKEMKKDATDASKGKQFNNFVNHPLNFSIFRNQEGL